MPSVVDGLDTRLYIVRMKRVTASEARKNWFRLLDEAAGGEVIAIERNGRRLVLRAEKRKRSTPSYKTLIRGDWDEADKWGWDWDRSRGLTPVIKK